MRGAWTFAVNYEVNKNVEGMRSSGVNGAKGRVDWGGSRNENEQLDASTRKSDGEGRKSLD